MIVFIKLKLDKGSMKLQGIGYPDRTFDLIASHYGDMVTAVVVNTTSYLVRSRLGDVAFPEAFMFRPTSLRAEFDPERDVIIEADLKSLYRLCPLVRPAYMRLPGLWYTLDGRAMFDVELGSFDERTGTNRFWADVDKPPFNLYMPKR